MKPKRMLSSLLLALAPLASACSETTPLDSVPAESLMPGEMSAPLQVAAEAPEVQAKSWSPSHAHLFPRKSKPFGVSFEDWSAKWWQWAMSIPKDENPMFGGPCELHQSGKVFFLAGTHGGSDLRSCTIPAGKAIFFPIVNLVMRSCPELATDAASCENTTSESVLHECASWYMENSERTLLLEIDGVAIDDLDDYRAHSKTFFDASPENKDDRVAPLCSGSIEENPCGVPVGSPRISAADGYWAMLRPLPVGQHQIRFAASIEYESGGGFSLDVTYDIVVAP